MSKLRTTLQLLSDYIECNTMMSGDIHFGITEAMQLRFLMESLEKEAMETEKIINHNTSASHYKAPENRKIQGKSPNECSNDRVNHPSHYTWLKDCCGIEVIDITRHMDFNLGNSIKYILRSGHKTENGMSNKDKQVEDLKKAIFYLHDEIGRIETTNNK